MQKKGDLVQQTFSFPDVHFQTVPSSSTTIPQRFPLESGALFYMHRLDDGIYLTRQIPRSAVGQVIPFSKKLSFYADPFVHPRRHVGITPDINSFIISYCGQSHVYRVLSSGISQPIHTSLQILEPGPHHFHCGANHPLEFILEITPS